MRAYNQCVNIFIDGSEYKKGALGLDWFPSSSSKLSGERYEDWVVHELNLIIKKWAGWSVLVDIFGKHRQNRKMYIRPYQPTKKDPVNAYAAPLNPQGATLKGAPQKYCADEQVGKDIPGAGSGTGQGSDVEIRYSPWMFNSGAGGPGTNDPDEILLHEMVHGLRQMGGQSTCWGMKENYDTSEEFVAILVTNIYRSESGRTDLRADHRFVSKLNPPLTDPVAFLNRYRSDISEMRFLHPNLFEKLKGLRHITFNPIALF
jgi:hypothetical protein